MTWCLHKSSWIALLISTLAALLLVSDGLAHDEKEYERSGEHLQYWVDATGQSDFITAQNQVFQSIPKNSISFGFTRATVWLRLQLPAHRTDEPQHWLEFDSTLLSTWRVYRPGQTEPVYEAGMSQPRSHQDLHRSPVYKVDLAPNAPGIWYFQMQSDHALNLNPRLHTQHSLAAKAKRESFFLGAYAGVMIFTYVLTLYIFVRTRHRNFLYYSCLLLSFHLLYQFSYNQMASLYLWPDTSWWSNRSSLLIGEITNLFGAIFVRDTLQTQRFSPRLDMIIRLVPLRSAFFIGWAIVDMSPEAMKYS
ncbi:MAG: hypothetical protein M3Q07_13765, partial [Pseudobdellovibrionaceae bacterium]|nr:hypothetical protein [Pseudobdellovibrionaceae bacterium]